MKILCDTHCHTCVSKHAFSTIDENIKYASQKGMELICITDHGPMLGDSPNDFYFKSLGIIPRHVHGVTVLHGIESNILDFEGNLDIKKGYIPYLDIVIASMHVPCYKSGTKEQNTNTWLNVLDNPIVDILGHIGDPRYDCDFEPIVKKAKEKDKLIEINNNSFYIREGSKERCGEVIELCKEYKANIVVSSDCHICYNIGEFDKCIKLLEEKEFPEELIMNSNAEKFIGYLKKTKDLGV